MTRFRTVIFWCHLLTGVFAGTVVLIMSVTGVLLTFEKQIIAWADQRAHAIQPPAGDAVRLPVDTLLARARAASDAAPSAVTLRADVAAPVAVSFGRERTLFVHPYTGAVLGDGAPRVRSFFRAVTNWHRWLGASDERRSVGRAITGACNLAFLFLVMSGFYLWVPRVWTRARLRAVVWFRRDVSGKARDFNWHNATGLWSAVPLFVIVLSATVISYPWASALVYRAMGEAPAPRAAPTGARSQVNDATPPAGALDPLFTRAMRQVPEWRTIGLPLPAAAGTPLTFAIDAGSGGQPQKRAQLTLDAATGEVVRFEPFSSQSRGRQLRAVLRFAHTGEVAGMPGQLVAGLASLGATLLVWTGLALSWRRFRAWRARRGARAAGTGSEARAA